MSFGRWWAEAAVGVLALVYLIFSWVVYSDFPRAEEGLVLGPLETEGLAVWRQYDCQACHRLHGFGGLLGPDLTNRIDPEMLDVEYRLLLTEGRGQMPSLRLSSREQGAVLAYLRAMNDTGVAQPAPLGQAHTPPPLRHFSELLAALAERGEEIPLSVQAGAGIWEQRRCGSCHSVFSEGPKGAPDLTLGTADRSQSDISVAVEGGDRMPTIGLTDAEIGHLSEFLEWLSVHRDRLVDLNDQIYRREMFSWECLPWFEFR